EQLAVLQHELQVVKQDIRQSAGQVTEPQLKANALAQAGNADALLVGAAETEHSLSRLIRYVQNAQLAHTGSGRVKPMTLEQIEKELKAYAEKTGRFNLIEPGKG